MRNGLVIDKENFPATLIMQSLGGSVAEWLACRKGMGSNRSRDAVG